MTRLAGFEPKTFGSETKEQVKSVIEQFGTPHEKKE
jgi:hypothetical protein